MLRFIVLFLASLWILPRLMRLLGGSKTGPHWSRDRLGRRDRPERTDRQGPARTSDKPGDPLQDLTQQDITDAEFEEIPPEE